MPRPRFSEMLVTRRRQLGLSISQASQVLRLKEQVLIAFEEGDFDHIPKSGYAQGMLSSYARYLGLNPRQVVNQFSADLNEYTKTMQSSSVADDTDTYLAPRKLLPTSGGPAGDLGAFATTSQPHSRQQSAPLVTRRYVGTLHDEQERSYGYDVDDAHYGQSQQASTTEGSYVTQYSSQRTRAASTRVRRRTNSTGTRDGSTRSADEQYVPGRDLDEGIQTSTSRSSRRSTRNANRSREVPRRRGGLVGSLIEFFSVRSHLIGLGAAIGVLLLVGVLVFAVRSCSSSKEADSSKTVPVTQSQTTDTTNTTNTTTTGDATGTDTTTTEGTVPSDPNAATTATTGQKDATDTAPKETKVTVKVDAGQVSWVEVLCDGESKIATTVTGPWSETYDVHESITIEVGDTAAVVVTENGKQRQFESKTSGIGTLTIQGTPEEKKPEDETEKKDEDKDSEDEKSEEKKNTSNDSGDDEFLYTYDGYDIYYNADNDLYYFFDEDGNKHNAVDGSLL